MGSNSQQKKLVNLKKKSQRSPNDHLVCIQDPLQCQVPNDPYNPPVWSKNYSMPAIEPFTENSCGPDDIFENLDDISPYAIFCQIFDDHIIDHIVFQTNFYATQVGKQFTPTTEDEIRTFLGINLYMGINRLPSYRDYWSSASDLHNVYISNLMSVKRFSWLLNYIHFNNNHVQPKRGHSNYDKLYKIRPILNYIGENFNKLYKPHREVAIDEAMVKFKGRSSLKQFMKDKPIKRGYKIWMLCDKSGYNLKFQVYTGKCENSVELGLGARVVLDLCEGLEHKNHVVYMDNFFSSNILYEQLLEKNIYACGTVRFNRKYLPTLANDNKLQRGDFDWATSNRGLTMFKWKDRKSVHLLSSLHSPSDTISVNRKEKNGSLTKVPCPTVLKDYNANMNFVDNFDRLKKDYQCDRKSRKWYMRIFFHMLDCCVTNAFIIHKELPNIDGEKKLNNKNFRREVYGGLLATKIIGVRSQIPNKTRSLNNEISNHKPFVPKRIRLQEAKHQPVRGTSRRCAVCSTKKKPVRTIWMCHTCQVPLCLKKETQCFQIHHTK